MGSKKVFAVSAILLADPPVQLLLQPAGSEYCTMRGRFGC